MKHAHIRIQGASHLLLVLVVLLIISVIGISMQLYVYIQTRSAGQALFTQQSYYAAESALYETFQRLKDEYPAWPPSFPYEDTYTIGVSDIRRKMVVDDTGVISLQIEANTKGTKRALEASFGGSGTAESALDIVLVIDRSGSMGRGSGEGKPIEQAKRAAESFASIVLDESPANRVGLVSYSTDGRIDVGLTQNVRTIQNDINRLSAGGSTNIADAILEARKLLDSQKREGSRGIILVMSDGLPTRSTRNSCRTCSDAYCPSPGTGSDPDNVGTCCSDDTVDQASTAKAAGYTLFSINLLPENLSTTPSSCSDPQRTVELGRRTLLRVSNEPDSQQLLEYGGGNYDYYYETASSTELVQLYEDIARAITSPGFFEFSEVIPE